MCVIANCAKFLKCDIVSLLTELMVILKLDIGTNFGCFLVTLDRWSLQTGSNKEMFGGTLDRSL